MKKLWIGMILMICLLAGGVGFLLGSGAFFGELSQIVENSGELALTGNWSAAGEKMDKTQQQWDRYRRFWASFTDHEPIEQMQALFSQMELYRKEKRAIEYASACRSLAHVAEAIGESHSLKWWSLL